MDPNRAIHNVEYDRMEPAPLGLSHMDWCPLSYEEAEEDAVCLCEDEDAIAEAREDARSYAAEQRYDASKEG